jgi:hypothetical protein
MEGRIVYTRPSHGDGVSHACLTGSLAPAASGFDAVIADFALSTEIAGGAFQMRQVCKDLGINVGSGGGVESVEIHYDVDRTAIYSKNA